METKTKILTFFFIAVAIISLAGFFNSYIRFLPDPDRFPAIIHVHFSAFILWFILIILQPVLIRQKKYRLHRKIGKLSYFIVPVLVITILILVKNQTEREIHIPGKQVTVTAFMGLLDAVSISVYYIIAMVNRRNVRWHVAFLVATTLVIFNPGLSRLLNQIKPGLGLTAAVLLPFVITITMITVEKIKYKRAVFKSPYFLFLCFWTFEILLLITVPDTEFWQNLIANNFK